MDRVDRLVSAFKALVTPGCGVIGFVVISRMALDGLIEPTWYLGIVAALLGVWRVFRELNKAYAGNGSKATFELAEPEPAAPLALPAAPVALPDAPGEPPDSTAVEETPEPPASVPLPDLSTPTLDIEDLPPNVQMWVWGLVKRQVTNQPIMPPISIPGPEKTELIGRHRLKDFLWDTQGREPIVQQLEALYPLSEQTELMRTLSCEQRNAYGAIISEAFTAARSRYYSYARALWDEAVAKAGAKF